jgi:hypothetical protein
VCLRVHLWSIGVPFLRRDEGASITQEREDLGVGKGSQGLGRILLC